LISGKSEGYFNRLAVERGALAVTTISLLAAILVAIVWQPPNTDEFYTYYVTLPSFGLREALFDHWLVDNHPPLFYGLARATVWLGSSIEARRLVNVILGFAILACGMMVVRNDRKASQLAVLFFLFLAGQFDLISEAANLRSYFLSLCAAGLLVLTLTAAWFDTGPLPRGRRFALAVAILISLNVHIVTTLIAGMTLAAFLAGTLLKRRFELLWAILVPALIAGTIFLAITVFQIPYWLENTATGVSHTITEAGRLQKATHGIIFAALQAVGANVVVFILGGVGGIALLLNSWKCGKLSINMQVVLMLGMSILCVLGLILPFKPLRIFASERFLLGLIPVAAMSQGIGR